VKSRLIAVSGTGTAVGKTHFAEALLRFYAARFPRVIGLKPIETGLCEASVSDAARLERASTFHVQPFGHAFAEPLSPHLAARRSGQAPIRIEPLVAMISEVRDQSDVVVVELPGGLFTPISDTTVNADLVRELDADAIVLVAPDRLGVLHDVLSTTRAAQSIAVDVVGIVLVAPEIADASTGHNAAELTHLLQPPILLTLPRADVVELSRHPAMIQISDYFGE
jgi:dethiobiotin synthetase